MHSADCRLQAEGSPTDNVMRQCATFSMIILMGVAWRNDVLGVSTRIEHVQVGRENDDNKNPASWDYLAL